MRRASLASKKRQWELAIARRLRIQRRVKNLEASLHNALMKLQDADQRETAAKTRYSLHRID